MDFKTLEAVVWIDRVGGFRAAAEHLNTTQPALSHRIMQLEQELGVELFQRQRPHVILTERGREFLRHAERLLDLRAQMVASVRQRDELVGVLRLGIVESIVYTWLPEFLRRMSQEFPRVVLEMEVDNSPILKAQLAAFELNLAFVAGSFDDTAAEGLSLLSSPVRFVHAPTLDLPERPTLEDIVSFPIITFSRKSHLHPLIKEIFGRASVLRPRIHASSSMATITRMALDGIGIALIPTPIVRNYLDSGELIEIEVETTPPLPNLEYWAVWPRTPRNIIALEAGRLAASIASETIHR